MNHFSINHFSKRILSKLQQPRFYVAPLVCSLLLPTYAVAFGDIEGIEVSGEGNVIVQPDHFSLTLTVTERGRIPDKIKVLVDKKSDLVITAAKKLKVDDNNITSARVNLRIIAEKPSIQVQGVELHKAKQGSIYVDGKNINQQTSNQQQTPLFELSRQITVSFTKIEDYDSFLSDIIKFNVSHISPLAMSVADKDAYYQQALLQAITDAKTKAENMMRHTGGKIDKLEFLKEVSSNHSRAIYSEAMFSSARSSSHNSLTGNQTINARVLVRFSIKD